MRLISKSCELRDVHSHHHHKCDLDRIELVCQLVTFEAARIKAGWLLYMYLVGL